MEYQGLWETSELSFSTKNRLALVDKINELLFFQKPYQDKRSLLQLGVVDEPNETIRQELLAKGLTPEIVAKILASNHKILQDLLLGHKNIDKKTVDVLVKTGASRGVKNTAKELVQSKRFKNEE